MSRGTTTRKATHARTIVSNARCPKCGAKHVVEAEIRGERRRLCAACSHVWPAPEPEAEA